MPRIEPVPMEALEPGWRSVIEDSLAKHKTTTTILWRIIGHSPRLGALFSGILPRQPYYGFEKTFGTNFCELLRVRSAQLGGCDQCNEARHDKTVSEDTIVCATNSPEALPPRERLAVAFLTKMHTDHHSIDDAFYRALGEHFTLSEIVELAAWITFLVAGHRMVHTLDMLGTAAPALRYDPAKHQGATAAAAE